MALFPLLSLPSQNAATFSALLQQCIKGRFTGLVCAQTPDKSRLDALLLAGEVRVAYITTPPASPERLAPELLMQQIDFANAPAQASKLPAYALRLLMLFIESAGEGQSQHAQTSDILSLIPTWQALPSPSLVSLHWSTASGLLYLPGQGAYTRHSVFLSSERIEQDIVPAIEVLSEPTCHIVCHNPNVNTPAWREYHQHLTFLAVANTYLGRYEQFGGRPVMNDLVNQLTELSAQYGWNMSFVGAKVINNYISADENVSAHVYRSVLQSIFSHSSVVLGASRTQALVRALDAQCDPGVREYVRMYELVPLAWLSGGE